MTGRAKSRPGLGLGLGLGLGVVKSLIRHSLFQPALSILRGPWFYKRCPNLLLKWGRGDSNLIRALKFHDTIIPHTTSTEQARLLPSFHLTYFNFSHRKERESTITTAIISILDIVCTKLFFICSLLFILL